MAGTFVQNAGEESRRSVQPPKASSVLPSRAIRWPVILENPAMRNVFTADDPSSLPLASKACTRQSY